MSSPARSTSEAAHAPRARSARASPAWQQWLTAGGTDGNERLTGLIGLALVVLLAAIGVTIVRIGQLLWLHLFLGLVLLGPVALKLLSTGYRFVRYYTHAVAYRLKGPPHPLLRGLAPLVVLSTLAVFGTGVALLILGRSSRHPLVLVHKVSFIAWIAFTGLHVLGHLPELLRVLRAPAGREPGADDPMPGEAARWLSLATAVTLGLVVAIVLIPQFSSWTG